MIYCGPARKYRMKYRSYRLGYAQAAKGQVTDILKDAAAEPHLGFIGFRGLGFMGLGCRGLGFRVQGLGFRVW